MARQVCVVGAGVMGLATALQVLESLEDVTVTIVTESTTPDTTSDGAGGFWQPYMTGDTPTEKLRLWSSETFQYLLSLSHTESAATSGVYLVSGEDVYHQKRRDPFWSDIVLGYRHLTEEELQRYPGSKFGYSYTSVMCEGKKYLPWLMNRIKEREGKLIQKTINSFDELSGKYDVIVNCTGLGSRLLCDDKDLQPGKGQLIKVEAPWIKHFLNADDDGVYILVNCDSVILGGTNELGDTTKHVNQKERQRIWKKCCELIPSLKRARYISDWVGHRPSRSRVRLERETVRYDYLRTEIVHNYGHGGAGITLHWGCAKEATKLVLQALEGHLIGRL